MVPLSKYLLLRSFLLGMRFKQLSVRPHIQLLHNLDLDVHMNLNFNFKFLSGHGQIGTDFQFI
jgi:hypothetical protein